MRKCLVSSDVVAIAACFYINPVPPEQAAFWHKAEGGPTVRDDKVTK
jgi:hypothetical protein